MNGLYNWKGIKWPVEQDVALTKRVIMLGADGLPVIHKGKLKHPTRERVRQKRLEVYLKALKRILATGARPGEDRARARLLSAMEARGAAQVELLKEGMALAQELRLESPFRKAVAKASSIYRPSGWHGRKGTIKEKIDLLPVTTLTAREIAAEVSCGVSYVAQALKELETHCKRAKRGKLKYEWWKIRSHQWSGPKEITDKETAGLLGIPNPMVVTQYRNRQEPPIRKWKRRHLLTERRNVIVQAA